MRIEDMVKIELGLAAPREMDVNGVKCMACQWHGDNIEAMRGYLKEVNIELYQCNDMLIVDGVMPGLTGQWVRKGALLTVDDKGTFRIACWRTDEAARRNCYGIKRNQV